MVSADQLYYVLYVLYYIMYYIILCIVPPCSGLAAAPLLAAPQPAPARAGQPRSPWPAPLAASHPIDIGFF